ncbi:MAG TPA: SRPBCC domain-containing protein [Geminicoccaceae bacterium]
MPVEPSLTLVRRIKALPAKVYAAWTDPVTMARWWGPDPGPALSAEADVRPGGRFRVVLRGEDGEQHDSRGTYREVVPGEKLVFTWHWASTPERESLVTVLLRPVGDGTELTLIHERFFDEAARDRHSEGWSGALDKLQALFA